MSIHQRPSEPFWYKDAVIYQLHVRSFCDSTADGIGDFQGLAQKLDYIRDLGVTAIWLLPFYPSPLRDDGYDIAEYTDVNPSYGTLADFKHFLREAHARGLRVITELVVNHTSDQHAWFQRARRSAPGSTARNFYVWSDTPEKYRDARIIFKDFETSNWSWDPVANAYFWHRFYSHQPDLNFANPAVRKALLKVMDFWFDLGVDGFRLDAVPYLHEREGTTCENLPETHDELKALRAHVDAKYGDRMLLAEANQWPEDAVAYFGDGDECHMAFHFPLMPRMFMAVRMEDRYPIIDILKQTPSIPDSCQWALFLRNHDELTLEMVTDEERDYMYRMYAKDRQARINLGIRRRLAPLLGNDRKRIELMNGILLSLPGTPVIYYGDEIGMGDNIYLGDRNAVRTPMQWSADRNAGFSRANAQKLFLPVIIDPDFSYEALNVEAEHENLHSLLWWMRRVIALRQRLKAVSRGSFEFLYPSNRKILSFLRKLGDEQILVVANLSRFVQYAELDLSSQKDLVPVELFGHTRFPAISERPYFLTLAPHSFYWFSLEKARSNSLTSGSEAAQTELPSLEVQGDWRSALAGNRKSAFGGVLNAFLATRRWFGGKARPLKGAEVLDVIPIGEEAESPCILLVRADYVDGDPESYQVALAFASGEAARKVRESSPQSLLANLTAGSLEGVLYAAERDRDFSLELLDAISRRRHWPGQRGELVGVASKAFKTLRGADPRLEPRALGADQSNTSIAFGDRLILKLFRRLHEGLNPDVELGTFLTDEAEFPHVARVAGHIEYRGEQGEPVTLAILQGFMHNEGDAWNFTLDNVSQYFERVLALIGANSAPPPHEQSLLALTEGRIPPLAHDLFGTYLEAARLLGQRTAELHLALASHPEDPRFAPEPFTLFYQRSLFQSFRNLTEEVFDRLSKQLPHLDESVRADAERVLAMKPDILKIFRHILAGGITALRTRVHGDYHLGQVLWTGRDFVIIDFEGEPARPISARSIKRSPLRDTAGMIRSFHYVVHHGLRRFVEKGLSRPELLPELESWSEHWFSWASSAFLRSYLRTAGGASFLPQDRTELHRLLSIYLLEKAVYELGYELDHRPQWLALPLRGIAWLVRAEAAESALPSDTERP